ncbi:MFS transporter [Streptomyces sp. SID12501]|uniref:MFS transporter n=1 Tax=Streptomyces sp. SID12501 TaxID=2706042 RepID=A0A6B3BUB8_9ACTN|nr:MFS transporter [Streptomyces sp. SID12501]NEC87912.1 MFS transporter [Streptomyces sp. SID12501]
MTRPLDIPTASRRYVTVCTLFWLPLGLTIAPGILLFTERGMTMAAIAGFFAAHSLTAAALELPTGGLSDVLGRRTVLAAAGLLNLVALALLGLGTTPWVLGLGMALMGTGRALSSGPAEAWYVDTVHAHSGPGAELRTGLARGSAATSAALASGTLLGGALPWLLGLGPDLGTRLSHATSGLVLPLSVPLLLGAAVEVAFVLYVLTALPEPPRPAATLRDVLRGIPVTVAGGLRLGRRDVLVRRVFLSAGAVGSALAAIELLTPGRAAALTGASESGAVLFAALACAGFICGGLGSHLAPLIARLAGSGERAVMVSLGAGASGLLLLGATAASTGVASMILAATGYGLVYLGLGAAGPSENDILHRRVDSAGRATALSVQSLALQLVGALTGLVVGVLPPGPLPWLLGGTALLAGTLLWAHRSEPTHPTPPTKPQPHTVPSAPSTVGSDPHQANAGQ